MAHSYVDIKGTRLRFNDSYIEIATYMMEREVFLHPSKYTQDIHDLVREWGETVRMSGPGCMLLDLNEALAKGIKIQLIDFLESVRSLVSSYGTTLPKDLMNSLTGFSIQIFLGDTPSEGALGFIEALIRELKN